MPFPVHLLRNHADCDAATAALTLELRIFTVRDQQLDLQADLSEDRATERATALQNATAEVARLTPLVANLTAGTPEHRTMSQLLRKANHRLEDLSVAPAPSAQTPVDMFLKAVDVRQVQVQVPELEQAIAEVATHHATLTA
jgi:hypothetical protein